jgi:hypothetical protein
MKMSRLTPVAVLVLIASSALGQITGERPVSTPVYGPSSTVLMSAIASDGDGFLAVWLDGRAGPLSNDGPSTQVNAVYASRIAADGTVLDPFGILLAKAAAFPIAIAWTGDRYLVVWNGPSDIMALQVGADGRILAPERVAVHHAQLGSNRPIASNGNVTVLTTSPGYAVLDRDANVINSDNFPAAAVYLTGTGEFVLTAGGGTMRLDSSGRYATRTTRGWSSTIACRPDGCITVFGTTNGHLAVSPYDPAALVVGQPFDLPKDQSFLFPMDLVAAADGYVLLTNTVQRLNADGHPAGPPIPLPGAAGNSLASASNGRAVALLRYSGRSLNVSMMTSSGVTQPATVVFSANAQHDVDVARGNANYLAVWVEKDGTYAGRLSLDGLPLDGRGFLLGPNKGKPSALFDGASYLVVLRNDPHAFPFSYKPPLSIVQVEPATGGVTSVFRISAGSLRVASNGFSRIAVWTEDSRLVAAFLSPNGTLASVPVFVAAPPAGTLMGELSVAWNGRMWLVAWEEAQISYPFYEGPPDATTLAIRGARLSADLTPLDTQPITIIENEHVISSSVGSDGRDFLVAWSSMVPAERQPIVRVQRIVSTGASFDTKSLFHGTLQDLVWDGTKYDLAFSSDDPIDLAVARLQSSGQLIDTLAISATLDDDRSASLLPLGNGSILAAYTRVAYEPLYGGVERAFVGTLHALRERPSKPH